MSHFQTTNTPEHVFPLTDSEKNTLSDALEPIEYDPSGSDRYVNTVRRAMYSALPARIMDVLGEQKASLNPLPYLLFRNLPIDAGVHTTPTSGRYSPQAKTGCRSENLIIGIASLIGEPYAIRFEGEDIVNNLVPTKEAKAQYTGLGSELELDFHIENAALKFMGDYNFSPLGLLLTGVRHDALGPLTRISDARRAIAELSPQDLSCLRMPLYRIKLPYRWREASPTGSHETDPVPLIRGNQELPDISAVFYPDMVEPQSEMAATAMRNFYQLIKKHSFGVDVKPGMLAYIDNRFALHSRDKFTPTLDATGQPMRWVQRTFVAANLWNHRHLSQAKQRVFEFAESATC